MMNFFKTFKYYKNTRYIALTALVAALMVAIGSISISIPWFKFEDNIILQFADSIFLPLIVLIPGPCTMVAAIIFGVIIDSLAGYFIIIPATVLIRVLIFIFVKLTYKVLTGYGAISLWYLLIFLYVGWNGIVNGVFKENLKDTVLNGMKIEAITDIIQYGVTIIVALSLYNILSSKRFKPIFDFDFILEDKNKLIPTNNNEYIEKNKNDN